MQIKATPPFLFQLHKKKEFSPLKLFRGIIFLVGGSEGELVISFSCLFDQEMVTMLFVELQRWWRISSLSVPSFQTQDLEVASSTKGLTFFAEIDNADFYVWNFCLFLKKIFIYCFGGEAWYITNL